MAEAKRVNNLYIERDGEYCVLRIVISKKCLSVKLNIKEVVDLVKVLCTIVLESKDINLSNLKRAINYHEMELEKLRKEYEDVQKRAILIENLRTVLSY